MHDRRPLPRVTLWLLLLAFLVPSSPSAQPQDGIEWGPWQMVGPIDVPGGPAGIRTPLGPERELGRLKHGRLGPRDDARYEGKGGRTESWRPLERGAGPAADEAPFDLGAGLDAARAANAAIYLHRRIDAEEDTSVPLLLGADDALALWLNGELLVAHAGARGLTPGDFSATLELRRGKNHLLVKVVNGGGAFGFQMLYEPESLLRQAAALERQVDTAIDRGVDYLLETQYPDGSWSYHTYPYRNGQTALSLYALRKSGVPASHPACQRAVAYLKARRPVRTYSAACQLMALESMHDETLLPQIEAVAELLLEWREGGYAYPDSHIDLSNTQYGALGLRAAARAGVKIRDRVWIELAEHTLTYQSQDGGFGYLPGGAPTGSMTSAGLTVFGLAREALADRGIPKRLDSTLRRATEEGLDWLARHWSVERNTNAGEAAAKRWHPYFLYGLERVGGLLALERIGGFDWYSEGARLLVRSQGGEGNWSTAYGEPEPNTAFALLFLERATAVVSGDRERKRDTGAWGADDPAQPLSLRASGKGPLAVWVSSWGDATEASHAWPVSEGGGLRVRQVEYLVDDLVVQTIAGDPAAASGLNRYPARLTTLGAGTHRLWARVTLAKPPPDSADVVVESQPLEVTLEAAPDPTTFRYGLDARESLLGEVDLEVQASGIFGDAYAAARALDGRMSTCWLSPNTETEHRLTIELERAVKADTLLLSHALPHVREPNHVARAKRVLIVVNKNERKAIEAELDGDVRRKTTVSLGRTLTVRSLEVRVLESTAGARQPHAVGFAEVELLRGR